MVLNELESQSISPFMSSEDAAKTLNQYKHRDREDWTVHRTITPYPDGSAHGSTWIESDGCNFSPDEAVAIAELLLKNAQPVAYTSKKQDSFGNTNRI